MDLKTFAVEEIGVCELYDAQERPMLGEDGKPMTITVYSPGSKVYGRAQAQQSNRLVDKIKRKGKTDQTHDEKLRENADFLCGVTKEFSSNIQYEALEGEALHRAVYQDPALGFIADQVAKFVGDWSNFTSGFTKPSTPTLQH